MSKQIVALLKRRFDELALYGEVGDEVRRNTLKEELQYFVLNFIYHHTEYSKWVMYGGSALRIIHGLNRMSVDLDFEVSHAITKEFLHELKGAIEYHFVNVYGADSAFLEVKTVGKRGVLLKFHLGEELNFAHPSKQVHVKIDLNYFVAPKTVTERRPINRDQLSFVVLTYNMSALMASKLAAIFLRGTRGVGEAVYEEKGRDIYDLLWYMDKKAVPDFDYLKAKNVEEANDLRTLFDKLTIKMNSVSNENLKQDLLPLFMDRTYIENWLANWLETYLRLLEQYEINTVTSLGSIRVHQDFHTDSFSFFYSYKTQEGGIVQIVYNLGDYWLLFREGDLPTKINAKVIELVEGDIKGRLNDKLKQYITLFHDKSEAYLKKTNRVMLGDTIHTKLMRMSADKLNPREQIVLNKSALLTCELDDLLR